MTDPGPLIGAGRSANVFDLGDGTVLRRYHEPRDTELEVAAMEHVAKHGFPVPSSRVLSETEIVMERIDGHSMVDDLGRRPWLLPRHARTLATLHQRLHAIEGPDWLPAPLGEGNAFLHLDLHPDNVMVGDRGPVVIDWANAARGPADGEVAFTWTLLAYSLPPTGLYRRALSLAGRRLFLHLFMRNFDARAVRGQLTAACAHRLETRNLPEGELEKLRRLLARLRERSA